MVKHSWGAGADRQVALLTESWWWRKRAGGGTLVMVDEASTSLTWTDADLPDFLPAADFGSFIEFWIPLRRLPRKDAWGRALF